jgi:hypothetical protein
VTATADPWVNCTVDTQISRLLVDAADADGSTIVNAASVVAEGNDPDHCGWPDAAGPGGTDGTDRFAGRCRLAASPR